MHKSLGKNCIEYVYIYKVKENVIVLNEKSIDYEWLNLEEFIEKIDWFEDKENLIKVLNRYTKGEIYFKNEKVE